MFRRLAAYAAVASVVPVAACGHDPSHVRLATTTSVENSGLLAAILPQFQASTGIQVDVMPVGSGRALVLLERGDADVGLTHDPDAEQRALDAGHIAGYRKLMFNDFVLVGPSHDPAKLRGSSGAVSAFRRLRDSVAVVVSRGDQSGTAVREEQLWMRAGGRPVGQRVLETGQGMGATLRIASDRAGYALTDRATLLQLQPSLRLVIVYEGGAELLNTYAVFMRASAAGNDREAATRLIAWLTDGEGRSALAAYRVRGHEVFRLWPVSAPSSSAMDLPGFGR